MCVGGLNIVKLYERTRDEEHDVLELNGALFFFFFFLRKNVSGTYTSRMWIVHVG